MNWIPAAIGAIGSLLGIGKQKQTTWMQTLTPDQQKYYNQLLNYLGQNMNTPAAGQYGANRGMYTLMNKFYPGAGYQMPTTPTQTSANPNYAALLAGMQSRRPMGPGQGMMGGMQ